MRFTEEHEALRRTTRQFVENDVNPHVDAWEEAGRFPAHQLFKRMGDLGLLGVHKPVEYGGSGLDYSYNMVVVEELGRIACGGIPMAIGVQTDMATPAIARFGSEQLKEQYLRKAVAGEYVASIAVSEVHAGSDVAAIKTKAVKEGDDYVINGSKMWITNSLQADFFCLLANTSDEGPYNNKSLIIVPSKTPGISFSKPIDKLGQRSSDTAQVFFDNVRVPQTNVIGAEGMGFMMQMMQFQEERIFCAASALGGLTKCIELTTEYARSRMIYGRPLLDQQVVHYRLAELQTEIECLRGLVHSVCEQHINGENVTMLASMAKLKSGRLMREVTDSCLQYWGGQGFTWENPLARAYRDGRLASIGGGADEVMLGIICKLNGTLPGKKR